MERPPSLKLILKVGGGNCSTPEHGSSESPVYGVQPENLGLLLDYPEKHKKSKKEKRKKEKRHKHHKEMRKHRDEPGNGDDDGDESSQKDMSINEDNVKYRELMMKYSTLMGGSSQYQERMMQYSALMDGSSPGQPIAMKSPPLKKLDVKILFEG